MFSSFSTGAAWAEAARLTRPQTMIVILFIACLPLCRRHRSRPAGGEDYKITATSRRANSAASAGSRSAWFSAQRYSIMTLPPSPCIAFEMRAVTKGYKTHTGSVLDADLKLISEEPRDRRRPAVLGSCQERSRARRAAADAGAPGVRPSVLSAAECAGGARRGTLVGSMMPFVTRLPYSLVCAS
jgi:hypothetical protein